ncbi:MAG: hypothetical protein CMF28_05560 [Kiritimatiellaceae bacterium]|nr:hypothetical protein [Kiritimatiellaceae bacterium]
MPPDHTRLYSMAGSITIQALGWLRERGVLVDDANVGYAKCYASCAVADLGLALVLTQADLEPLLGRLSRNS